MRSVISAKKYFFIMFPDFNYFGILHSNNNFANPRYVIQELADLTRKRKKLVINTSLFLAFANGRFGIVQNLYEVSIIEELGEPDWPNLLFAAMLSGNSDIIIYFFDNCKMDWDNHEWRICFENLENGNTCPITQKWSKSEHKIKDESAVIDWDIILAVTIYKFTSTKYSDNGKSLILIHWLVHMKNAVSNLPFDNRYIPQLQEVIHIFFTKQFKTKSYLWNQVMTTVANNNPSETSLYNIWINKLLSLFVQNLPTLCDDLYSIILEYITVYNSSY